jgi:hypothetical protein
MTTNPAFSVPRAGRVCDKMGSLLENERDCPYETFDESVEPRPHQV